MRKILLPWTAGLGAAISLVLSSCAYDPYYSSAGGYYGGGTGAYYGDGYGYGGSSFSTSMFVTTGDSRWGYDPNTYCYYDYRSRRYYDPYLYGYYPVGYRPYAVYGAPHPYGWRQGHGHCPPPRTVRNVTVVNYRDRESAYRNSNYSWARQVKQRPSEGTYRQSDGDSRHHNDRKPDYRNDSRSRHDTDRDSYRSNVPNQWDKNRSREYALDSNGKRGDYRPQERPPSQEAGQTDSRRKTREFRPEPTRGPSMTRPQPSRPQLERPKENRGRDNDQPRGKSSDSPEKKTDSGKSNRKGLRSLGDA